MSLLVIFSKSLIGDTLFSYLVRYLENERNPLCAFEKLFEFIYLLHHKFVAFFCFYLCCLIYYRCLFSKIQDIMTMYQSASHCKFN